MIRFLRPAVLVSVLAAPALAQSVVPVPRPSAEERAARAEAGVVAPQVAVAAEATSRPLTEAESAAFIAQVSACWNTASLPPEAEGVVVRVGFSMTRAAEPIPNTFELVSASDADQTAADLAFLAARRAVIRCGQGGYVLPDEAFTYWERVEITFDPSTAGGQ